jgi:ATP-dependent Clp protease ATP-binding subunit ClpC
MINDLSPFAHFDNRAKLVVELSRRRAESLRSRVIGPEHMLLALLSMRHDLAARAVSNLVRADEHVATGTRKMLAPDLAPGPTPSPRHIPFAPALEQTLTRAAQHAKFGGDDRIGTEHLLLGLLLARDNPAVRALSQLGVDYAAVRAEIARLRREEGGASA